MAVKKLAIGYQKESLRPKAAVKSRAGGLFYRSARGLLANRAMRLVVGEPRRVGAPNLGIGWSGRAGTAKPIAFRTKNPAVRQDFSHIQQYLRVSGLVQRHYQRALYCSVGFLCYPTNLASQQNTSVLAYIWYNMDMYGRFYSWNLSGMRTKRRRTSENTASALPKP